MMARLFPRVVFFLVGLKSKAWMFYFRWEGPLAKFLETMWLIDILEFLFAGNSKKKSEHSNEAESQWSSGCKNFDSSQEHSGLFRFSPSHHRNIESLTITIDSTLNIKVSGSPDSCHVTVIVYNVKMANRWVTLDRKKCDSILGTGQVVKK